MSETSAKLGGRLRAPSFIDPTTRQYQFNRVRGTKIEFKTREQVNVELAKRIAKARRDKEELLGRRKDAQYQPIASIPWPTMRALAAKYGIDPVNCLGLPDWQPPTQADLRRLERIIELETPHLKTTNTKFNLKKPD